METASWVFIPSVVLTENNAEKTKDLRYTELVPALTKAVQEQQDEVKSQQAEITELRAGFDKLKASLESPRLTEDANSTKSGNHIAYNELKWLAKCYRWTVANCSGEYFMTNVYVEARPKGRPEGDPVTDYVVEDHSDSVLAAFPNQSEAITWARAQGHAPLVARVRHLNDKKNPDHWRSA